MPGLDTSIPLQAKAPQINPLQLALQAQQYKYLSANANQLQQAVAANQATSRAFQGAVDPATGQLDTNKLSASLSQDPDAAYNYAQTMKAVMDNKQAQLGLEQGQVKLSSDQIDNANKMHQAIYQRMSTLDPNDPNFSAKVMQNGADLVKEYHADPDMIIKSLSSIPPDPQGRALWLQRGLASTTSALDNLKTLTPTPTPTDTGGSIKFNDTNPVTNPSIIGTTMTKTLDPATASTPTAGFDLQTNTPIVIPRADFAAGNVPTATDLNTVKPPIPPGGVGAPQTGQQAPLPPGMPTAAAPHAMATGPALGTDANVAGTVDTVNKHWGQLSNDAANAQQNIGLAQNIKTYADQALTGKTSDKLAAANGLLSIFGVKGQTDLNTATDLLQKNMARLSLSSRAAAGGTDAAGALATAANPHGTMTAAAIKDAADQVIGQQQMALAEQKVLQPYKLQNNPAGYQQALTQFNQAADPRVWQFANMNPQQQAQFKASMSAADQQAFRAKMLTLHSMGAL